MQEKITPWTKCTAGPMVHLHGTKQLTPRGTLCRKDGWLQYEVCGFNTDCWSEPPTAKQPWIAKRRSQRDQETHMQEAPSRRTVSHSVAAVDTQQAGLVQDSLGPDCGS